MEKHPLKVVCIEDEIEMIDLLKLVIERHGHTFFSAEGGREGLDLIERVRPDVILLDLMMPEMDGQEVYRQLKRSDSTRDIPIVIVTARAQSIDRALWMHIVKVDDYVTKPFSPSELIERIDRVIERKHGVENGQTA